MSRIKVLFVCPADVSTAQSFIHTIAQSGSVRVLLFDSGRREPYPPQRWIYPTVSVFRSSHPENGLHQWIGLPDNRYVRFLVMKRPWIQTALLRLVIRFYRPDLIHTIGIDPEAALSHRVLTRIPKHRRPPWVVTTWSNDLFWDRFKEDCRHRLLAYFQDLDWLLADCRRDLAVAVDMGLSPAKVLVNQAIPGIGSLEVPSLPERRRGKGPLTILAPKAYDGIYHKPHVMLEALSRLAKKKHRFKAHIVGAQEDVRIWCRLRDPALYQHITFYDYLPRERYLDLLSEADVVLAPSLTDGTPNALLEAMAYGALPVFSDHESIKEWVRHGQNGLLVDPVDCRDIEAKLSMVFKRPALIDRAAAINNKIIRERTGADRIRELVIPGYESLIKRRRNAWSVGAGG